MAENNKKFVIQKHVRGNETHWDLMLEEGTVLETYRLPVPPEKLSNYPVEVIKTFDHPLKFLSYQGSVNEGQGSVEIADSGTYKIVNSEDNRIKLNFTGKILNGKFILRLIEADHWALHAE